MRYNNCKYITGAARLPSPHQNGILVPGGFGKRGIDGMLNAIRYARENRVPYFGICLGMQTMVIEFARNICGLEQADSTEFNPGTPHRVIFKLRELKGIDDLGILRQLLRARRHLSGRGDWRPQRGWHTGSEPTTKTVRLPFCISFTTAFGNGGWAAP